jgi:hypothetical protein
MFVPAEPSVVIDVTGSGLHFHEPPAEPVEDDTKAASSTDPTSASSAGVKLATALLPAGLVLGGLDTVRDETVRGMCSHVISICTKEEFDLDVFVNPHGYSIPAFGHNFKHTVMQLTDSPLAGPLVNPLTHKFVGGLTPAFEAIDEWVAASNEWTVGGRSKQLLIHSVHGYSRPAAVLCAWLMARGNGRISLADALHTCRAIEPSAAPNFGFILQLLEHERFFGTPVEQPLLQQPSGPSVCVWEYAGLEEAEWKSELARSKGVLDRTSARRILAASLRRRRRESGGGGGVAEAPNASTALWGEFVNEPAALPAVRNGTVAQSTLAAVSKPTMRIDFDAEAVSDAAIMSALGGESGAGLTGEIPIDADRILHQVRFGSLFSHFSCRFGSFSCEV